MNTYSLCLCILATILITPSSATLSDLFGGAEPSSPPQQVRQIQQFGQLAQSLQQLAPNPAQLLNTIGQYGPQLLELANQAQKFFSEDENESNQQQGQGQGPRYGPQMRQLPQKQIQIQQQQQQRNQQPQYNLNKFGPQEGDNIYYGPESDSPQEVVHVHRHIIEHRGPSGSGAGYGGPSGNQGGQNVRIYKIIHEQGGNSLGSGYGSGYGGGYGHGYDYRH
ncbi:uncharacterized protein LOC129947322 [Eupeodes corollae]|uniref:uncharacterized protein LOC129947322 n=1 Tax=Eupeodes corollae TaxID=290404 RepID=UPI0024910D5D|nr:uncharacterized protein LOC129947322 [Eupeodes corollae]